MNVKCTLRSTYSLGRSVDREVADRVEALVVVVDLLLEVRHPAAVDLGDDDVQRGEAVEHAGEDQLDDAVRRVEEAAVAGQRRPVRGRHRLRERHVDRQRDRRPRRGAPNTASSSGSTLERAVRVAAHRRRPRMPGTVRHALRSRRPRPRRRGSAASASPPKRSGAYATYSESQSLYALHERVMEVGVGRWRTPPATSRGVGYSTSASTPSWSISSSRAAGS